MPQPHKREAAIFDAALELPPEQRAAYLEKACANETALRERIESLLRASEGTSTYLDSPAPEARVSSGAQYEKAGDRIGRYKLLQQIGAGGCGVVYMAEQEEPVRRLVALKVIKLGMDTKSVIARFEAERQALAMMDHPNIAKVLDGGATEAGRPYFVMELVRGMKLTDYCDQARLSTCARLELFIQVCQAIQHAHQKGIIHRDIKPSNILVTLNDGVAVPKVIDFGIAKATSGQRLTDKPLFTAFEQFIGTPAYMSPEQALLTSVDVDTRSDIYGLGVLLYELLTGQTPFDAKELLQAGLEEMRRTIREKEPERPSARLSTMAERELTLTANHRQIEGPKLVSSIRGDLDWIVLKCLEKDRARRYETANELASDLQRHLNEEPVLARPPGNFYRIQKLVRRNKLAFAAATAIAASLLIGLGVSTWMFLQELQAKRDQVRLRQQAQANEIKAQANEKMAQTEAAKSQQVAQFLKEMLEGVGPSVALGRDTTMLRDILDRTAKRVKELRNQPEVEFELSAALGQVYCDLGEYQKAEEMQVQALAIARKIWGEQSLQAAAILQEFAHTTQFLGRQAEAEKMVREALAIRRTLCGNKNAEVAGLIHDLAYTMYWQSKPSGEIESLYREALAMKQDLLGHDSLGVGETLNNLAIVLKDQGKLSEAEGMYLESLRITRKLRPEQTPDEAMTLFNIGDLFSRQEKLAEAESAHRESLAIRRKVLGEKHPDIFWSFQRLASLLKKENRSSEAESLLDELIVSQPQNASAWGARGEIWSRGGRWKEAAADLREAIRLEPKNYVHYHLLAPVLIAGGDLPGYRLLCRDIMIFRGTTDPIIAEKVAKTCLILPDSGADLKAVSQIAETPLTNGSGKSMPWCQFSSGLAEYRQGHPANAERRMREVLDHPPRHPERDVEAFMVLAMAQWQMDQAAKARATLAAGIQLAKTKLPESDYQSGRDWNDRLIGKFLMQEATALLQGEKAESAAR